MKLTCNSPAGLELPRLNVGEGVAGPFLLTPGDHEVPDEYWEKLRELTVISRWAESGALSFESDGEQGDDWNDEVTPVLGAFNAKEAIEFIESESDVEALRSMRASESRVTVQRAIDERIEQLSADLDG